MRRPITAVGVALFLVACTSPPDPLDTVMAFQEHKNVGNLDGVVALFADEPSLHFGPLGTISGLADVRAILEYDLALNTHLEFQDCTIHEAEVSCRVVETNDWLETAGIESIDYDENRFAFSEDGRIQSVHATLSMDSAQSLGAAVGQFHQWATENRPSEYSQLFSPNGAFNYSGENAHKVLDLLRAWRDE